jgi:hypothetical protein
LAIAVLGAKVARRKAKAMIEGGRRVMAGILTQSRGSECTAAGTARKSLRHASYTFANGSLRAMLAVLFSVCID